ncbi:MAG: NfeD family protein [Fibrobacterota bacterium]
MNALMWAIALQILSVALLLAEIFLPSGGMLAIATAAALVGSLVVGFNSSALEGWILLGLDLVLFPYLTWWGIGKIKNSPMGLPQTLEQGGSGESGLSELVGQTGVAETDLRPVGRVRIGDKLHDAQARTGFVTSGTAVEVVSAEGNHLVVKTR